MRPSLSRPPQWCLPTLRQGSRTQVLESGVEFKVANHGNLKSNSGAIPYIFIILLQYCNTIGAWYLRYGYCNIWIFGVRRYMSTDWFGWRHSYLCWHSNWYCNIVLHSNWCWRVLWTWWAWVAFWSSVWRARKRKQSGLFWISSTKTTTTFIYFTMLLLTLKL